MLKNTGSPVTTTPLSVLDSNQAGGAIYIPRGCVPRAWLLAGPHLLRVQVRAPGQGREPPVPRSALGSLPGAPRSLGRSGVTWAVLCVSGSPLRCQGRGATRTKGPSYPLSCQRTTAPGVTGPCPSPPLSGHRSEQALSSCSYPQVSGAAATWAGHPARPTCRVWGGWGCSQLR